MHTGDDVDLDAELVELLRRAAAELPGYRADPAAVARRRAAIRWRHGAVAVAAGLTVTALLGGVALLGAGRDAPGETLGSPPAPQRLFVLGGSWLRPGGDGSDPGATGLSELLPDGRLVAREVAGLPTVYEAVGLPDGGFVALGSRTPTEPLSSPAPGASRTPPPDATQADGETVAVVRPDGSVRYLTDTAATSLIGADDRRVYLGGAGTVALDLATGRQQRLDWPDMLSGGPLAAGRFAVLTGNGQTSADCAVRLLDARTGGVISQRPLPYDTCYHEGTALSPDGRWLGIVQPGPLVGGNFNQLKLVLLNVDTGERTVQVVDEGSPGPDTGMVAFLGMAWLDDGRLWLAWTHPPGQLRMTTVAVPVR